MTNTLLWKNLVHDPLRFAIAVAGIGFSAFLMTVQSDLLFGFTEAASRIIDATDGAIWIMPRGVPCFDYATHMPAAIRERAHGVPGVAAVGKVAAGFTAIQRADGLSQVVLLIGIEDSVAGRLPTGPRGQRNLAIVDVTDAQRLGAAQLPADIEIAAKRARIETHATGFASFLGSPYLFTAYQDALEYLSVPSGKTMFVIVKLAPGADASQTRDLLQTRFPEFDVWEKADFSRRARLFWLVQTGAGGALSLAAVLGFVIGLAVVSQTMYAATMEHLDEFATLKALGASNWTVRRMVIGQSFLCGIVGAAVGFLAVPPAVTLASSVITWIVSPLWMYALVGGALTVLCAAAALLAVQPAISIEPGRVFRA